MVPQILASLTSKPTLFVPHWSPHLWSVPHTLLPKHYCWGKVCPGDFMGE